MSGLDGAACLRDEDVTVHKKEGVSMKAQVWECMCRPGCESKHG